MASPVKFVSVCCDPLFLARDIVYRWNGPRWENVCHYQMDRADKEKAKQMLGFSSVPFYVVLNRDGGIEAMGMHVRWDDVRRMIAGEVGKAGEGEGGQASALVVEDLDF